MKKRIIDSREIFVFPICLLRFILYLTTSFFDFFAQRNVKIVLKKKKKKSKDKVDEVS